VGMVESLRANRSAAQTVPADSAMPKSGSCQQGDRREFWATILPVFSRV
jgi:hypothetical protein